MNSMENSKKRYLDNLRKSSMFKYMLDRGFTAETLNHFEVGLSHSKRDELSNDLNKYLINDCGTPVFTHRIMIPYHDKYGGVVGFTGRTITDIKKKYKTNAQKSYTKYCKSNDYDIQKYKNSSTSEVFNKSETFFNLHTMPKDCTTVIIFESQMNAMAFHQVSNELEAYANIDNIPHPLATGGTALTNAQIKILKDKGIFYVIMAYDGDKSGVKAVIKSTPKLCEFDYVSVIKFPKNKDMTDLLKDMELMNHCFLSENDLLMYFCEYLYTLELRERENALNEFIYNNPSKNINSTIYDYGVIHRLVAKATDETIIDNEDNNLSCSTY